MKPVYKFRVLRLLLLIPTATALLLNPYNQARGEGTRTVMPSKTTGTGLIVSTTSTFPLGNVGSYLPASGLTPKDQRIYFYINNASTEKLNFGFNWETLAPGGTISTYSNVYMNVYDPNNNLVATYHLPGAAGAGFISSWNNAIQGPLPAPGGYSPLTFTPAMTGDYWVCFYQSNDGGVTHVAGGESMLAKWFDMTVVQNNVARLTGRVHCNEWAFSVYDVNNGDIQNPQGSTNAQFYAYTKDSVVTRVYFPNTGFEPLSFIISFNDFGVKNNGNWIQDRRSIVLPKFDTSYLNGGYKVFLNPPDQAIYPICNIPSPAQLITPVISGCPPGPYTIRFNAPQPGDYYLLFDLSPDSGYQAGTADRFIELVNQPAGVIPYPWDGKDGLGNLVPANSTFPIRFSFRKGRINLPFYDVELNLSGFRVDGYAPVGAVKPNTTLYWDDTQLYNRGTDCSDNNNNTTGSGYDNSIMGVSPTATKGRAWSGNGNPNNNVNADSVKVSGQWNNLDAQQCDDYGNARLINTWAWGIDTTVTQYLTLTCVSLSGTVWDDANNSANGTFSNIYTTGEWATNAGNGLYASLIDPITGNVVSSVAVAANGTFTLNNCPINSDGMIVQLSTTLGITGNPAPATGIPTAWLNTSPVTRTVNVGTSQVTGLDFGVEQLPNSDDQNYTIAVPVLNSYQALNGAGTISSPGPLTGSDPEDGTLGGGKTVVITQVPSNEELYYNGVLVTNNTTIPNYNVSLLQVKWISITQTSTSFKYAYVDAAGKQDPSAATYTINMSTALAMTLSSFNGRIADAGNVLTWTSLNEANGTNFTIQRSTNGSAFMSIGSVSGNGNGGNVNHTFTDINPTPNTSNYYRLQWTGPGGGIAYSNVVTLTAAHTSAVLEVSPNPFKDQVNVRLDLARAEKVTIRLLDSKGTVLRQAQYEGAKGSNAFPLNGLATLPSSVYLVQIVLADQVFVKKTFKQ